MSVIWPGRLTLVLLSGCILGLSVAGCHDSVTTTGFSRKSSSSPTSPRERLLANAYAQINETHLYDPTYVSLAYPGGDVPRDRGVCTDVVIRALRATGIDLQKEVHEDMQQHFAAYPGRWGMKRTDPNIDHRRVPNLQVFLQRRGKSLAVTRNPSDYLPGDIVTWQLPNGRDHMGIVSRTPVAPYNSTAVIHNIGQGVKEQDCLFSWKVTGHYRYFAYSGTKP